MTEHSKNESQILIESQSRIAIGIFILVFGMAVLLAVFFTDTLVGKYANIFSGLILLIIGLAFGITGWRQFRTLKR
jgi:protein-S-isoprenylcysteine O-methyltransferase Ste14